MATLDNIAKNRRTSGSGGEVFFGFMFLFTQTTAASGPLLNNYDKHSSSLINSIKH